MMKRNIKRRGFTLVELLIVIVVIGILSAMMMLSSTEAVTSAKASNIVSNLRNLKTAALAMYIDSMDELDKADNKFSGIDDNPSSIDKVIKYMNGGENFNETGYNIGKTTEGDWYLKYTISGTNTEKAQIKQKLEGRAKSVGLLKTAKKDDVYKAGTDDVVYYFVR